MGHSIFYRHQPSGMCNHMHQRKKIEVSMPTISKQGQAWILALDIWHCPVKNRIMSNKSCFPKETVVHETKENLFISY